MALPASRALEKIQKGTIAAGYLLLGTELYWRDRVCVALQRATGLEPGSFGLAEFDLRQDSLDDVLGKAESQNLLAPRQLLFIKNAQGLLSRRGKQSDSSLDKAESSSVTARDLEVYFRRPNLSSTLVFEMTDLDLEPEDWRERDKVKSRLETFDGAFHGKLEVVLLSKPGFGEAMELVRSAAAERGRKITPQAAEQLVAAFNRNMALIGMELEKLCLYDPEKESINVQDLNAVVAGGVENISLGLPEAVGGRDLRSALQILDQLKRGGMYAPLVVSELARYFRQLIIVKESKARDSRQAGKVLWDAKMPAPQSLLPKLIEQARTFPASQLLRALRLAFQADLALRSGPPDESLILERFVMKILKPLNQGTKLGHAS